ncbi:hypothetical protein TcasGA2_TC001509 [Tribolium castaneum]|uniref:CCHC-type domain-containing protein n=1 Tax=Tribolium castaneum TaxID=7070 RepID=D7EM05_TRICA|nr:hypothetical protein TcasGA2_TC001509 [Tribolium castaneum]
MRSENQELLKNTRMGETNFKINLREGLASQESLLDSAAAEPSCSTDYGGSKVVSDTQSKKKEKETKTQKERGLAFVKMFRSPIDSNRIRRGSDSEILVKTNTPQTEEKKRKVMDDNTPETSITEYANPRLNDTIDLMFDEANQKSVKQRKIQRSFSIGEYYNPNEISKTDLRNRMKKIIRELGQEAKKLNTKAKDNNTTKTQLRDQALTVCSLVSQIANWEMLNCLTTEETPNKPPVSPIKSTEVLQKAWKEEENNKDVLKTIIEENWSSIHHKTEIINSTEKIGNDMLILVGNAQNKDLIKRVCKHSDLIDTVLKGDIIERKKLVYNITSDYMLEDKNTEKESNTKINYILGTTQDNCELDTMYLGLEKVLSIHEDRKRQDLTIVETDTNFKYLQKIIEYLIRHNPNIQNVKILKKAESWKTMLLKPTKQSKETINIRIKETTTYHKVVREMKKEIDPVKYGVRILDVFEPVKQLIRIKYYANDIEKKKSFLEKVKQICNQSAVSIETKTASKEIFLKDIPRDCIAEDIAEAINKTANSQSKEIDVFVSPDKGKGSKFAVATVPAQIANTILEHKRIRIGWDWCRIEERIRLSRCFGCMEFGHTASNCKTSSSKDKEKLLLRCLNCGADEHTAKTCENKTKCYSCGAEGHRPSSMSCPNYKKAVNELKAKNKGQVKENNISSKTNV